MKTLTLPLKKQWFDMIKAGVKKEEYREIKPRYLEMFCTTLRGDGPIHKCWCRHPDVPPVLHDYYGKACSRWERTLRFDKEEAR